MHFHWLRKPLAHGRLPLLLACILAVTAMAACVAAPPAAAPEAMPEEEAAPDNVTVFGETLPDNALPYSQQVYRLACSNTATQVTFDFAVSVYQRICSSDQFGDALVTLDKDFNVRPLAADSWEPTEDGLTWHIKIRACGHKASSGRGTGKLSSRAC